VERRLLLTGYGSWRYRVLWGAGVEPEFAEAPVLCGRVV
jgi:hypothetical protein